MYVDIDHDFGEDNKKKDATYNFSKHSEGKTDENNFSQTFSSTLRRAKTSSVANVA